MKKFGLCFTAFLSIFAVSFGYAQEGSMMGNNGQQNERMAPAHAEYSGNYQEGQEWEHHGEYQQGGEYARGQYQGGGYEGGQYQGGQPGEEHACGEPVHTACGDCYCLYCKYEPCYYNKWNCHYEPQYTCKRCCRQVPQYYEKQNCRYVPQYYTTTCCRYVPQYYYTKTCHYIPKYECQKCCKYVPKYYYKKLPRPAPCEPVCAPAPACDTGCR